MCAHLMPFVLAIGGSPCPLNIIITLLLWIAIWIQRHNKTEKLPVHSTTLPFNTWVKVNNTRASDEAAEYNYILARAICCWQFSPQFWFIISHFRNGVDMRMQFPQQISNYLPCNWKRDFLCIFSCFYVPKTNTFVLQCALITVPLDHNATSVAVFLLFSNTFEDFLLEGYNTGKVDRVCTKSYNEILSFLLNTLSITTFIVIIIIITIVFSLASCSSHWRSRVNRWNLGAMMRVVMVYSMDQLLLKIWTVPRRTNF